MALAGFGTFTSRSTTVAPLLDARAKHSTTRAFPTPRLRKSGCTTTAAIPNQLTASGSKGLSGIRLSDAEPTRRPSTKAPNVSNGGRSWLSVNSGVRACCRSAGSPNVPSLSTSLRIASTAPALSRLSCRMCMSASRLRVVNTGQTVPECHQTHAMHANCQVMHALASQVSRRGRL